ncbi:MAG TPA: FAD-dependent oxidoreductase [Bryobacteraceae bacterium]|nr:FAD-dependent oxidoreductase [Bryobacteraceae bacterium]
MSATADVVIIGAGIVGASIAWHLTSAGCRNVILLERETQPGAGSTGKSMGGVRAQFSLAADIRMSRYSIPVFRDFEALTGHPSGYRPRGYLFVATQPRHVEALRANHARQLAEGVRDVRLISRDEIVALVPQLRADDVLGGSLCASDGFVDPHSVLTGFLKRAAEQGAQLVRGARVTGIDRDSQGIAGVRTSRGSFPSRVVVNAAGAWAAEVAALAGVQLPVEPLRRTLVPTESFDRISHDVPMTVDMATGFHFRPEGLGFLMAWNDPAETLGFKLGVDRGFIEKVLALAADRVPVFAEAEVNPSRAWSGLYEVTPDHHPILGPVPQVPGLFLANGFSGHGVMHSPATGKILADLILEGRTSLTDVRQFDLARFPEGRLVEDTLVL